MGIDNIIEKGTPTPPNPFEDNNGVWWWYDECGDENGPYSLKEEAAKDLTKYGQNLNQQALNELNEENCCCINGAEIIKFIEKNNMQNKIVSALVHYNDGVFSACISKIILSCPEDDCTFLQIEIPQKL